MPDFTSAVVEFKGERLTWTEVVGRLRAYDEKRGRISFDMGDLALAVVPMGDDHARTGATERLTALADAAGVSLRMLEQRRQVSHGTPEGTRVPSVAWSAYREVALTAPAEERPRLLEMLATTAPPRGASVSGRWTVSALRVALGKPAILHVSEPLEARLDRATVAEKLEAMDALQDDPAVSQAVVDRAIQRAEAEREWAAPDEPTSSLADHEARMKEWRDTDVAHQYDDALVAWTTFAASHPAEATAEAVARSPQTSSVVSYVQGAEVVLDWFRRFAQTLRQEQRPRLVLAEAEGA
jgi:hypothetical protein